jgi:hypothetical protein
LIASAKIEPTQRRKVTTAEPAQRNEAIMNKFLVPAAMRLPCPLYMGIILTKTNDKSVH